jgi:hypothetical protein
MWLSLCVHQKCVRLAKVEKMRASGNTISKMRRFIACVKSNWAV